MGWGRKRERKKVRVLKWGKQEIKKEPPLGSDRCLFLWVLPGKSRDHWLAEWWSGCCVWSLINRQRLSCLHPLMPPQQVNTCIFNGGHHQASSHWLAWLLLQDGDQATYHITPQIKCALNPCCRVVIIYDRRMQQLWVSAYVVLLLWSREGMF